MTMLTTRRTLISALALAACAPGALAAPVRKRTADRVTVRLFDMAVTELDKLQSENPQARPPLIAPRQLFPTDAVIYQVVSLHERVLLRSAEAPVDAFDVPLAPDL